MNKLLNYFKTYLNLDKNIESVRRQYLVFFIIGVISFLFGIIFLRILYKDLCYDLLIANTISFVLVSGINYILSIRFVFLRGKYPATQEIIFFYAIAALSLLLDNFFLYYMVEKLEIWYILAKFISVFTVSFITFALKKLLVFKK